ncbi:hypothetical protein [Nocardioides sp.]|uniref:hypothetical protein n=1 Tax=Nocardioides sp. TaxID=35761 RepID=UPI001A18DB70|nr:hypothetical protein [Nocardioides sp.]MBJ7357775.1 hypothetical protein [Nocardioides sp.]
MTDQQADAASQDVFDIANWLARANAHVDAPEPRPAVAPAAPPPTYVPRHRADVPADSVA